MLVVRPGLLGAESKDRAEGSRSVAGVGPANFTGCFIHVEVSRHEELIHLVCPGFTQKLRWAGAQTLDEEPCQLRGRERNGLS